MAKKDPFKFESNLEKVTEKIHDKPIPGDECHRPQLVQKSKANELNPTTTNAPFKILQKT